MGLFFQEPQGIFSSPGVFTKYFSQCLIQHCEFLSMHAAVSLHIVNPGFFLNMANCLDFIFVITVTDYCIDDISCIS
jgi:hypothetical protein